MPRSVTLDPAQADPVDRWVAEGRYTDPALDERVRGLAMPEKTGR